MNLVIDIGNTRTKLAVFDKNSLIESLEVSSLIRDDLDIFISKHRSVTQCIISSVQEINPEAISLLLEWSIKTTILDHHTSLPFINTYKTPETIGNDRIAAIAGASFLYPGKNVLIIDAGTAITFDLIDDKNIYRGGTISPGLEMRFKALNHYTAGLPLLGKSDDTKLLGQNTSEAIVNGVQNGMIFEIESYLTKISNKYPQLVVLLTGGDSQFFDTKLKKPIFADSNLTLTGLNFILEYNARTS